MEKLTLATANIVRQNIENLKELFPEAFTEGSAEQGPRWMVNLDKLREILGEYVEKQDERYSFTWNGKAVACRLAQTPSTGTLRPCPEESVNWDTTQNLFIEGDNLEVLKLFQKSYHKKVKMIYIDPPYNTGKEFIYPDKYMDNLSTYLRYTGQVDDEGLRLSANTETSGRYHTNWLNMMVPRLKLARNLLQDDGVIFISIDDNETANLRKICDEIFGEENFIAQIVWKKKTGAGSGIQHTFDEHEYVLAFGKNKDEIPKWRLLNEEDGNFKNPDNDIRGDWESCAFTAPSKNRNPNQLYMIEVNYHCSGKTIENTDEQGRLLIDAFDYLGHKVVLRKVLDTDDLNFTFYNEDKGVAKFIRRWAYAKHNVKSIFDQKRVYLNGGNIPRLKKFLNEYEGKALRSIYFDEFSTQQGTDALRELFGESYVEYPKPVDLIKHFLMGINDKDALILDFFAGSCSTAHAVLNLNYQDLGSRRFVMVQLPEPTYEIKDGQKVPKKGHEEAFRDGYATVAEIGKERIRRVIKKLEAELAEKVEKAKGKLPGTTEDVPMLDLGFKVFKLDTSNIKPWDADFDNLETALFDAVENIKPDRTEEDVLYELLLKYGLDLAVPIEEREIDGKTVYLIGAGALVVCLADKVSLDVVEGIAALRDELKPEVMRVVFKDAGFADDVVKTNAVQILRQAGIEDVKSL